MLRRLGYLAAALALVAVAVVAWRYITAARVPDEGPPSPGARGRLAFVQEGDIWTYDLQRGRRRRITQDGGASAPRWSRSGDWLSFERGGRLWVARSDGSNTFAAPNGDVPSSAQWAPLGSRLAYTSLDGSVRILSPAQRQDGHRIVVAPGSGAGPRLAWSPDGTHVAYERHAPLGPGVSSEGIWTISTVGLDPTPVFVAAGDYRLHLCCWTRTGSYVLFWQGRASDALAADGLPLYAALATSSAPRLVAEATLAFSDWVAPAPFADVIALVSGAGREATAAKQLVVAVLPNLPGQQQEVQFVPVEVSREVAPGTPAWSPRGGTLAYAVGPSLELRAGDLAASLAGRRIQLARPDGTMKRWLLPEATVPAGVSDEAPVWARDGLTIVFMRRLQPEAAVRGNAGQPSGAELWVASADGNHAHRVAGGIADPGNGRHGYVDWQDVFNYLAT
ncbi:MAG: hypothetical protein HY332_22990 [Chloroflexi bacterium]|nr:hypothetical protein [Chloroflexota bacterium]